MPFHSYDWLNIMPNQRKFGHVAIPIIKRRELFETNLHILLADAFWPCDDAAQDCRC